MIYMIKTVHITVHFSELIPPVTQSFKRKKMRLFTHNFLQCHVRSCTKNNFPLKFQENAEVQIKTAEFNADFLALQMCKIDYSALLDVLKEVKERTRYIDN